MRRKIVAISGSGRTGSTLLSLLLSQHSSIFNLGQLRDLWRAWPVDAPCTCGRPLGDCAVYGPVVREVFGPDPGSALQQMHRSMKAFFRDAARLGDWSAPGATEQLAVRHVDFLRRLESVLEAVQKRTGASTFIDASKSPEMALAFGLTRSTDLYVLNLVRDPRAVAVSWHRRHGDALAGWRVGRVWAERQRTLRLWSASLGPRFSMLRYESFAAAPASSIGTVQRWAGLGLTPDVFEAGDRARIAWDRQHLYPPANERVLAERPTVVTIAASDDWRDRRYRRQHLLARLAAGVDGARYERSAPVATPGAAAPRVLFAPVSGPGGAGELMRCLTIAREFARREPTADIRFLVSRNAVFRQAVEFPIIDLDDSPTRCTPQVIAAIESFRPDVMVFDNAGRTPQLRAAARAGARLVFSSRTPRLRWKAFRARWLALLDEHWIVFPVFVTGGLSWFERLKLWLFRHHAVRQFDTLFTPSDAATRVEWLQQRGLEPEGYVLFVPGGRGEASRVAEPANLYIDAARAFVAASGQRSVVLTGRGSVAPEADARLTLLPRVEPGEVQHLLAGALFVVSNGGTTMIHALAHSRPVIALPLASDQDRRVRRAVRLRIIETSQRSATAIAAAATSLLQAPSRRAALTARVGEVGIRNGLPEAVSALVALAGLRRDG